MWQRAPPPAFDKRLLTSTLQHLNLHFLIDTQHLFLIYFIFTFDRIIDQCSSLVGNKTLAQEKTLTLTQLS